MNLEFHVPPENLRPFVRRFVISDYEVGRPIDFHPWPTGKIYLIYFFGPLSNYAVSVNKRPHKFVFPAWLAGQVEYHDIRIFIEKRTSAVVAELTALGFWRLFGKPGRWLTGKTCQIADLGEHYFAAAAEAFEKPAHAGADALANTIAFLESAAKGAGPPDPILEGSIACLEAANGRVTVRELADKVGVTHRHFTRRFNEIVGLPPKFYGRVMQINQVVEMLFMPGMKRIADVAQEAGFYDQAHLNRAMILFFQEGPSAFLKGDHEMFRTFLEHLPATSTKTTKQSG